jgi:hypothetical protein
LPGAKNIALCRENEVWPDREGETCQTGFEQIDRTTGVDRPERANILQFANQFHAPRVEYWFANSRHKRAVEIDAQQFDW